MAGRREPPKAASSFATLLEFAVAVNRADPAAHELARVGPADMPIDGADVRRLVGTLWFRSVVPQLSAAWRTRLFDALRTGTEIPNHAVRIGRQQKRVSELGHAQLSEVATSRSPADPTRQDIELVAAIGRIWGDDAIGRLPFRDAAMPAAASGLSSLLQGIGFRPKASTRGAP